MQLCVTVFLLLIPLPAFVFGALLYFDAFKNTEMTSFGASVKKVCSLGLALFFLATGCSWIVACGILVKEALTCR